jgi:hypothetical protein
MYGLRGPSTSLRFAQDDEIFVLGKKDKGKATMLAEEKLFGAEFFDGVA